MKIGLVACSEDSATATIVSTLGDAFRVDVVHDLSACLDRFRSRRYDVTFLDLSILETQSHAGPGEVDYESLLVPFREAYPAADIVILAKNNAVREAVRATKAGASNYLTLPIEPEELRYSLENVRQASLAEAELDYLREEFWQPEVADIVRTRSPSMQEVFRQLRLVSPTKTSVLLTGETGTGKSLLARLIHQHSRRSDGPFVAVHCGAIPETLIESELFGHEKGAFTGALQRRLGKFEIAHGGTIFLDEVSTLTPAAQIKLLQVLQERTLQRVGGENLVELDVRIVAATNVDLEPLCASGVFRSDLYYRLNVFPLTIPPLRERPEDIPALVDVFLRKASLREGLELGNPNPDTIAALQRYAWPGNLRELENVVERAAILEQGQALTANSFPPDVIGRRASPDAPAPIPDVSLSLHAAREEMNARFTREYLACQLRANNGRIDRTAEAAEITPRQLNNLMKRYGLRRENFR